MHTFTQQKLALFLEKCRLNQQPIQIIYMDQCGKFTQRTVFVKRVQSELVTAFCTMREAKRTFLLANILAVQQLKKGSRCYASEQTNTWPQSFMGVIENDVTRA